VLAQYRMATTEPMHRVIAPSVRIEQTRRRLARLRVEELVDRITLPQAGRTRVWFPTAYGVQLASEWPEMRGRRLSRTVSDPTTVRLKAGHTLTVTETALVFAAVAWWARMRCSVSGSRGGEYTSDLPQLGDGQGGLGDGAGRLTPVWCTRGRDEDVRHSWA
jgi:hypothetical protein